MALGAQYEGSRGMIARKYHQGNWQHYTVHNGFAIVKPDQTFLKFKPATDPDFPHRPYVIMHCKCSGITAPENETFPHGATEIMLSDDDQIDLDVAYEFSNEEIADLVMKGLYQQGFQCPEILTKISMEIPAPKSELYVVNNGSEPLYLIDVKDESIRFSAADLQAQLGQQFEAMPIIEPSEQIAQERLGDVQEEQFDSFDTYLDTADQHNNYENQYIADDLLQNDEITAEKDPYLPEVEDDFAEFAEIEPQAAAEPETNPEPESLPDLPEPEPVTASKFNDPEIEQLKQSISSKPIIEDDFFAKLLAQTDASLQQQKEQQKQQQADKYKRPSQREQFKPAAGNTPSPQPVQNSKPDKTNSLLFDI